MAADHGPDVINRHCIIHLIRNTFRLASKRDWDAIKRDIKPIYATPNPSAARAALEELAEKWGPKYGAIIRLWETRGRSSSPSSTTTWRSAP